ncbi:MAG TPA: BlaI/MecI/CopY family transcriptional regulator [Candidatus Polarisedimenticolaceae bacterium]|nr:BlaI/MecI/CopY family transcriptional regulator [Candidatus Polarisedimenticolaceae bacterium]
MKLSPFEHEVMEAFWTSGASTPLSIREVHARLTSRKPLAYTTVQTIVGRLETKGALRRVRKVGNAHLFEPAVTRQSAQRRLVDEFLALVGGARPLMLHLVETGKLSLDDLREIESAVKQGPGGGRRKG